MPWSWKQQPLRIKMTGGTLSEAIDAGRTKRLLSSVGSAERHLSMSAEDNKALVRRFYEDAWNKHNPAVVDDMYRADFVDRSPDIPGIPHTRDGLKQFMGVYLRAFPDARITVEDQLVEGDRVVTRWTAHGTQTGEFMEMAPSGKTVSVTGIQIDRLSGGKIIESWTLFDQLAMLQQLGAVPTLRQAAVAGR
jgi:steroid delta-isomerase-like uncharacterized protein